MSSSTVLAPPVTTAAFLNVAENAAATPIGITAPTDPNGYTAGQVSVTITAVPSDGTALLNGAAITVGETLTAAQLAALDFAPTAGAYSQTSPLGYTVTDPAGASAEGTASLTIGPDTGGRVLTVGAGQQYATLAAAVAASQNGDTIEVQAGTYVNDFAQINTNITIEGVGGMAVFESTEDSPNGKAILVTDGNVTIDNVEFTGATDSDSNGAGIRYETGDLILNNDYFYNNQEGLLAAANPTGNLLITNTEFNQNGDGSGSTHNIYVGGDINSFTVDDSYFHDAVVGHEIKSRAANTYIYNSRILDLSGTASYSIDLPNGGNAILAGNVIQQGPNSENPDIIAYGEEGSLYAGGSLQMYGNTLLNNLTSGTPLGVWNDTDTTAQLANTQIYGLTADEVASGPVTQTGDTFLSSEPSLDTTSALNGNGTSTDTSDFNGDGKSDILWQYEDTANPSDPLNGNAAIWLMNGTTPTATTVVATAPPDWRVIGTGDFNGDGKSDILWQYEDTANPSDPLNGEAAIWLMNGTTPTATTVVAAPPPDWRVIGTGDFNGDGKSDILWQYEDTANPSDPLNGEAAIWLMNGTTPTATMVVAAPPPDWHAIATGDFNGDGKSDILWQYEDTANPSDPLNGEAAIWLMNGTTATATTVVAAPPPDWRVIGTGDFNGDGKSDILWQYEDTANPSDPLNGEAAIWLMNGTTATATTVFAAPPAAWDALGTGDFNGDGKSDVIWQYENTANPNDPQNGAAAIWLMNGTSATATSIIAPPPPSWHVIPA